MAGGRNRGDAGHDLLVPLVLRHLAFDAGIDLFHIGKVVLHHLVGLGLCGILLAHPEFPVFCRHHDLGIRKRHRTVGGADAVGVVGMQMRHQHDVDVLGLDPGSGKVLQRAADRALAGLEIGNAITAIDQHQLAAGVDELRIERHRHHALRHVGGLGCGERFLLWHVLHEGVGHREAARTVIDRGALKTADLVAIKSRCLRAGWRRGGRSSRHPQRRQRGRRTDRGGPCQQFTTAQVDHGILPSALAVFPPSLRQECSPVAGRTQA